MILASDEPKVIFSEKVANHTGSLGARVDDVSDSRTCSGSLRVTPNKLGSPIP